MIGIIIIIIIIIIIVNIIMIAGYLYTSCDTGIVRLMDKY